MVRPLDGITVISLEHAIAAPFCTRQLADLGARVIKVERPGAGDFARAYDTRVNGMSSHFTWVNRSKESLTLDLKQPAALAALKALVAKADVLVQNLAPGAAARMGLGADALRAAHPQLIVCDISGYGNDGPYRDKKAYDLLIQSEAGFLSVTGTPEAPCKAGCSVAGIAAGMYAYRVDGVSHVLRHGQRFTATTQRCLTRHHLPLRSFSCRGWPHGDAWPAKRTRVGAVLRIGVATTRLGQRPTVQQQSVAP